ncbi:acetyl-CoA carboxylase biotin carboxylase subunit [Flexithrix dorotheae]|uniref:acetyl-CoA carboxylase biotin carboxylase subunit n=1 Tax=Flexithrix dorotheae TaxID=70993 RepID=UPI0003656B81|nr:acetyl-CoA carboxylase biotin carboxylase subunit [Flexithrix dorotheae]
MKKFKKILIANRGEIALRVIRSAKELGIKTVAVFSDADRLALHTKMADEAVYIGESPSKASYLDGNRIIKVAKDLNVDAIHPGYGFLSENASFSKSVTEAGIVFIGPSPSAIEIMGSKLAAKDAVKKYNIPLIPGTDKAISDVDKAMELAVEIGYPILIKASAGGGGKGMRIVEKSEDFKEQIERAMSEANSAFGDSSVFIEKYITSPKHIEFQIMGDQHGNIVHLFERECSIQRRHQKVIEEAPSAVLSPELREKMGKCAVDVARACNYYGAGTVEFILDQNHDFFFLEMNTRLQVEHPVTEMITNIDLVKEQINVAQGGNLSFTQEDLSIRGHAVEVRVYAEDPTNNFLPDIGQLATYERPQGIGVRVDDGFEEGMEIPIFYDPMIAKLITYGHDRQEAIQRMIRAIDEYNITGIKTTLEFCSFVLKHDEFVSGRFDTKFVERFFKPEYLNSDEATEEAKIASILVHQLLESDSGQNSQASEVGKTLKISNWKKRLN